jgi:hypothetical protein
MLAASINIIEFIKREKKISGLFEYTSYNNYYRYARNRKYKKTLVLLEDYIKIFEHNILLKIYKVIRK